MWKRLKAWIFGKPKRRKTAGRQALCEPLESRTLLAAVAGQDAAFETNDVPTSETPVSVNLNTLDLVVGSLAVDGNLLTGSSPGENVGVVPGVSVTDVTVELDVVRDGPAVGAVVRIPEGSGYTGAGSQLLVGFVRSDGNAGVFENIDGQWNPVIPERNIGKSVGVLTLTVVGAGVRMELDGIDIRSEERRVGKECRSRWSPYH